MAFDMWMASRSQQDIASAIGYSDRAVREFLKNLQNRENGLDYESPVSSEILEFAKIPEYEFVDDEEDSDGLGATKVHRLYASLLTKL